MRINLMSDGRKYEYQGESLTIREWANRLGLSVATLKSRVMRNPNNPEKCFYSGSGRSILVRHKGMKKDYSGWAKYYGVDKSTFSDMVAKLGRKGTFDWYDQSRERRHFLQMRRSRISLRKRMRVHEVGGKKLTFGEVVEKSGKSFSTIRKRINVLGWTAERACKTPLSMPRVTVKVNGHKMLLPDVSLISGVPEGRIRNRLRDRNNTGLGTVDGKLLDPNDIRERVIEFNGEKRSLTEWAREMTMPYTMLIGRVRRRGSDDPSVLTDPRMGNRTSEQKKLVQELASLGVIF